MGSSAGEREQWEASGAAGASNLNSTSADIGAQGAVGVQTAIDVPFTRGLVQLVGAVQDGGTLSIRFQEKTSGTADVGVQGGLVVKLYKW
jgi:hypothetical protein